MLHFVECVGGVTPACAARGSRVPGDPPPDPLFCRERESLLALIAHDTSTTSFTSSPRRLVRKAVPTRWPCMQLPSGAVSWRPTVIVPGGANVRSFLQTPEIQGRLTKNRRARNHCPRKSERRAKTQAQTEAEHSKQAQRVAETRCTTG
jgi:hypothetical protein